MRLADWPRNPYLNDELREWVQLHLQSLGVDYPLLSDPSKQVATAYGVVDEDQPFASRWTFYVGLDGRIGGAEGVWWKNAYGWGFSPVNPVTGKREDRNRIPRALVGFANALAVWQI